MAVGSKRIQGPPSPPPPPPPSLLLFFLDPSIFVGCFQSCCVFFHLLMKLVVGSLPFSWKQRIIFLRALTEALDVVNDCFCIGHPHWYPLSPCNWSALKDLSPFIKRLQLGYGGLFVLIWH